MTRDGFPPNRRGETGPLGSNNAMADTDTSAGHHAVKKDEQATKKPAPADSTAAGREPERASREKPDEDRGEA